MRSRILLLLSVSICGCATPQPGMDTFVEQPLLYHAVRGNQTITLLGTAHLPIRRLHPKIRELMKKSSIVVTEVDTLEGGLADPTSGSDWHQVFDTRIDLLAKELKKERFALEDSKSPILKKCHELEQKTELIAIVHEFEFQDPEVDAVQQAFRKCVLADRNEEWIERMTPFLDRRDHVFVAVGLLHLYSGGGPANSDKSLFSLLKSRGYRFDPYPLP